ncbi:MAG: DUF4013 domain-containing protein [Acidobacteriota bacterium]
MPLDGEATPASPKEQIRKEVLEAPYSLWRAMGYSLRGSGLAIWSTGVLCLAIFNLMLSLPGLMGCFALIPLAAFGLLLVSLQFKISRATARGDVEAPDWPELGDFGDRILDFLTYLCLGMVYIFIPIVGSVFTIGVGAFFTPEPNLLLYLLVATVLWFCTALYLIAFGACSVYSRLQFINFPAHLITLFRAGGDGFTIANLTYVLIVLQLVVQLVLAVLLPELLANILGDFITMYWAITSAHLAGLLFRRHRRTTDSIYK